MIIKKIFISIKEKIINTKNSIKHKSNANNIKYSLLNILFFVSVPILFFMLGQMYESNKISFLYEDNIKLIQNEYSYNIESLENDKTLLKNNYATIISTTEGVIKQKDKQIFELKSLIFKIKELHEQGTLPFVYIYKTKCNSKCNKIKCIYRNKYYDYLFYSLNSNKNYYINPIKCEIIKK